MSLLLFETIIKVGWGLNWHVDETFYEVDDNNGIKLLMEGRKKYISYVQN